MSFPVDNLPLSVAWTQVQERLHRAAQRAGRSTEEVDVLAVTKNQPVDQILEARRLGLRAIGESRVQETAAKQDALLQAGITKSDLTWHLIGHLQSNKARRAVDLFDCLQSLDSVKLAERLNVEGEHRQRPVPCLLEIKISPEETKQGLGPDELEGFLNQTSRWPFLRVEGLMGMAPPFEDAARTRPYFQRLRRLFDQFYTRFSGPRPVLSMGMSQDFEVAVEEGSTLIRLGTILFGRRAA